jgi:TfoX/Sxy family transcriptional regulator of competence genes
VKYRAEGFASFQDMTKPAIRKVDYYKLHKSLYDYKTDCQREARESMEKLQQIMPIYSKQDIV